MPLATDLVNATAPGETSCCPASLSNRATMFGPRTKPQTWSSRPEKTTASGRGCISKSQSPKGHTTGAKPKTSVIMTSGGAPKTRLRVTPNMLQASPSTVQLDGDAHHKISRVLRLRVGDQIELFDGQGQSTQATVRHIDKSATQVALGPITRRTTVPGPVLLQAVIKGPKMDLVIQKATELGVSVVVPLLTEHTVVKLDSKNRAKDQEKKRARWQTIAAEASGQCERNDIPEVYAPENLTDVLSRSFGTTDDQEKTPNPRIQPPAYRKFYLSERSDAPHLLTLATPTSLSAPTDMRPKTAALQPVLAIGPEGGWGDKDKHALVSAGFEPASLGPNILRAETAAIAALAICQAASHQDSR